MIGIPLWMFLFSFVAYKGTDYYYQEKQKFIPENTYANEENKRQWSIHKLYLLSKIAKTLALLFGVAFPTYLLAYLDHSKELPSSLSHVICFFILTVVFGILSKIFKKRYNNFFKK